MDMGSTKAQVESTFIRRPIGPVALMVIISKKETITETISAGRGPEINPQMAMITSLRSKFRNPATLIGINLDKNITKMVTGDFELHDQTLIHALGHGVGLEVHEEPILGMQSELPLKANMVLADEPGIYIPGEFGVRIEDLVVVTKDGCERLNHVSKELRIIG